MPKKVLQPACIHSFRRHGIPSRMPQHVNVNRKRQVGDLATPFDHASDAHTAERLTALVHEYVGRPDALRCVAALERLEAGEFVPLQVVAAVVAAFEPAQGDSFPAAKRIAALALPDRLDTLPELEMAAHQLNVELLVVTVRRVDELSRSLDALQSARVDAFNVLASPFVGALRASIFDRLNQARLPAIYEAPELAEQGGLLGCGARFEFSSQLVARLASKILRGARPEDLPIEQPERFDLVVNLKTANAIGVTVPETSLARADKVVE
jgi:ABC transporter substrate binding protein